MPGSPRPDAPAPSLLPSAQLSIKIPSWSGKWVVGMNDFKDGVVGAKSKNIANLRGKVTTAPACVWGGGWGLIGRHNPNP